MKKSKKRPAKLTSTQIEYIRILLLKEWDSVLIQKRVGASRQQVAAVKAHLTMGTYS